MITFREWLAEKELNEGKEYKGSINGTDLYFITNLDVDSDKIVYEKGNYKIEKQKITEFQKSAKEETISIIANNEKSAFSSIKKFIKNNNIKEYYADFYLDSDSVIVYYK